ncbi:MAG: flavodoxin family protein, partial [Butyricicoccaceae bacterium]
SEPEEMKRHVSNILTLPSVNRAITEYRTEVFTNCVRSDSCRTSAAYLERARRIAGWVAE